MRRHIDLDEESVQVVRDAHAVLRELDNLRPDDLTVLHYVAQYDNLQIVIRDLLRVLGVDPDQPWPDPPPVN